LSKKGKLIFLKYRHLFFAIIIVIIVIILDIIFENYSSKIIEKVNGKIKQIDNILKEDQNNFDISKEEKLEKLAKIATEDWEEKAGIMSCFIEHEEIEKINVKLHLLEIEIRNNLWGDAKRTTSETKQLVKYLNGKYQLSWQNIL
jgi:hypothetical protein